MKNRALRRHHKFRRRKQEYLKALDIVLDSEWAKEYARLHENHRTPCSCHMCRNPRRSRLYKGDTKMTLQERKFKESCNE